METLRDVQKCYEQYQEELSSAVGEQIHEDLCKPLRDTITEMDDMIGQFIAEFFNRFSWL